MNLLGVILTILATLGVIGQFILDRLLKNNKTKIIVGSIILGLIVFGIWGSYTIQNNDKKELFDTITKNYTDQKIKDENYQKDRKHLLLKLDTLQNQLKPFAETAKKKYPQFNSQEALVMLSKSIESQNQRINALQNFSDVAMLGIDGSTGKVGYGLIETSPLIDLMKKVIEKKGDRLYPVCNSESLAICEKIINTYPTYPFSYYSLAICYRGMKNAIWKKYALKCIDILRNTTLISGHNNHHDQALAELLGYMKNEDIK